MKTLAITSILALSIAAPALAQSQLERSVGAQAGQYTIGELALLASKASESGGDKAVYLGHDTVRFSASNVHNPTAQRIFKSLAEESRGDE